MSDSLVSVFYSLVDGSEGVPDKALMQGQDGKQAQDVPPPFVGLVPDAGLAAGRRGKVLAGLHDCQNL